MSEVIQASGVAKKFGKKTALTDVTLRVGEGSVVGLIGPNGAGKTTLMRILMDIVRPSAGMVTVLGQEPRRSSASVRERIGYLPGDFRLTSRHSARHVLTSLADISGSVEPSAIEHWAERLNLDLTTPVKSLSKGNKQKVGLIQAFMHQPELLILDEPTSGLDPLIQREFVTIIGELKAAGATVLLSSHVLGEIQQSADRVAVLSQGSVVADGPLASLALTRYKRVRVVVSSSDHSGMLRQLERLGISRGLSTTTSQDGMVSTEFRLSLPVNDLVKALSVVTITDLAIHEPDLEEAVLGLYDGAGDNHE